ncbi:hypothetical protein BH11PAT3_BH11PAT3_0050 [soil metagenome]
MNRKPLIITISIALIIVFGALGWYFYTRTSTPPQLTPVNGGLPFGAGGGNISPGTPAGNSATTTGLDSVGRPTARLFRLVDTPVSGWVSFIKNGSTIIRYVDRATGHIMDVNPVTLERTKITNNTLPKIYEADFKNDASGVVLRSLKDGSDEVQNLSVTLIPPKATSTDELYQIDSTILIGKIGDLSVAPDNSLFYTTLDTGSIIHSGFKGEKQTTLFTSDFTNWKLDIFGTNILLTSKSSINLPSYAYSLNNVSGGLTKLLGPLSGLSVSPSSSGAYIAYSYGSNSQSTFRILNTKPKAVSVVEPATLGEKCTWSSKSAGALYCGVPVGGVGPTEPDSWYQGVTHFTDRIWRFNAETGFTDVLSDPKKDFNIELDVENPHLSPDEDYLLFRNRDDQTLWALRLN